MHSTLVRTQNVFGFFTTVAFCTAILVALSVLVSPQNTSASIDLRNIQVVKGRPHYYSPKKEEYAHIRFDLDADFSSLFNWNTKQLFVWVLATYPSSNTSSSTLPPSQAIIWDDIISSKSQLHPFTPFDLANQILSSTKKSGNAKKPPSIPKANPNPGVIHMKNTKPKYQITDISGKLASRENVTLEVGWNVQPWVGALTWTMRDGQGWGRWKGMRGGKSKVFGMPALKGKTASQEPVAAGKGKPKVAGASPVL